MPLENIFLVVGILLLTAKIFGEIAERLNVSALVGQIIGGIIVGPVLGLVALNGFMEDFFVIPIIFLLFMTGMQIKFDEIKQHIYSAGVLAFMGGFLSFVLGALVGLFFFHDLIIGFAIGVVLVSTSDVILFQFLMETGQFNSKAGKFIISVTIADDVIGILFMSFFSTFVNSHTVALNGILFLFFVCIGFYLIMFTAGARIFNAVLDFCSRFMDENILFTVPIAFALFLAYVTDNIGMSVAAGAFLTGMSIANSRYSESVITPKTNTVAMSFFVPIFYAGVGTLLVLKDLNFLLIAAILAAAVFGKLIGVGFISRFYGLRGKSQRLMGVSMITRGNDNIATVQIILAMGIAGFTFSLYTSIIFAMILTIIITPFLLKAFCEN